MTIVSLSPKQGQTFLHFRSYLGILPSIISTSAAVAVALQHPQSTRTAKMDPGVASSATASMNESGSEDGSEDKAYRDLLEYRGTHPHMDIILRCLLDVSRSSGCPGIRQPPRSSHAGKTKGYHGNGHTPLG